MGAVEFEFVPHTADIAIKARGSDLAGLIRALALGLTAAALGCDTLVPYRVPGVAPREVEYDGAPDEEGLVVDFLNELIFQMDALGEVYTDLEILACDRITGVRALAYPDPDRQATHAVKAATYYDAHVRHEAGGVEMTVVFDV